MTTAEIIDMVRELSLEEKQEILRQVLDLIAESDDHPSGKSRTFGDLIDEIAGTVPDDRTDGAEQHDHYLYGAPRR